MNTNTIGRPLVEGLAMAIWGNNNMCTGDLYTKKHGRRLSMVFVFYFIQGHARLNPYTL